MVCFSVSSMKRHSPGKKKTWPGCSSYPSEINYIFLFCLLSVLTSVGHSFFAFIRAASLCLTRSVGNHWLSCLFDYGLKMKAVHFGTDNKSTGMFWIPFLWCFMQRGRWAGVFERFLSGSSWGVNWWPKKRTCWGEVSAVGQSGGHFFQVLRQYPLKKLYLGKDAHARVAGKNLQVRSQNLLCGESERSLAVIIIIIIDYNSRQQQLCTVNGRSLSICYYFAGNCHQACDWMQKDKTTHPFTLFQSH